MNKTKIIIILSSIVLVWSILIFVVKKPGDENQIPFDEINGENETEDFHAEDYPTEESFLEVEKIYNALPKPLENYIPDGSSYTLEYLPETKSFVIGVDAENIDDFEKGVKEAFEFFYQFNLNPCEAPLLYGLSWTVDDWSKIDFKEKDPFTESCNELN